MLMYACVLGVEAGERWVAGGGRWWCGDNGSEREGDFE